MTLSRVSYAYLQQSLPKVAVRGAGAVQPPGGEEPDPPPRTAPLRRELYPYSRDSATALLRRADPPFVPTGEHKQSWLRA